MYKAFKKFSRRPNTDKIWEQFSRNIFYQAVDGTKIEDFRNLKQRLDSIGTERKEHLTSDASESTA